MTLSYWLIYATIGAVLGLVFFLTLKLTVQRMVHSRHPARVWLLGLLVRFMSVLAGFTWLTLGGDWTAALIALGAFILVRLVLVRTSIQGGAPG